MFDPTTSPCDCSVVPQTKITYGYYDLLVVPQLRLTESSVRGQANDASNIKPAGKGVDPPPSPSALRYCGQTSALLRHLSTQLRTDRILRDVRYDMMRRFRVSKQTVWGSPRKYGARQYVPGKARRNQAAAHPKPRSARQTFEGQPRPTRRGVYSFPREPSGDEATAAVETRAVDKWLPCLNLLDCEWDKDSDSDDISISGGDLVVYSKGTAVATSTRIQAMG